MSQDLTNTIALVHPTSPDVFSEALRRVARDDMHVTRRARRTYADMAPGESRQSVLTLAPNVSFLPTAVWDDGDEDVSDVCPVCLRWSCICGKDVHAPAILTAVA